MYFRKCEYTRFFRISMQFRSGDDVFAFIRHQNDLDFPANAPVSTKSAPFFDKMDFKLARYLHHIPRAGKFLP
ncbi:hypothetical protein EFB14_04765 [Rhizobium fabae]|uniref:Uncharacterized protein n=1 Tax=Rhizobium fabae TaxID=573179 RepID=A0ABY0BEK4_9HYPH|nr:hypothetical protein EFB14_04765 [Rhizobium fabae]